MFYSTGQLDICIFNDLERAHKAASPSCNRSWLRVKGSRIHYFQGAVKTNWLTSICIIVSKARNFSLGFQGRCIIVWDMLFSILLTHRHPQEHLTHPQQVCVEALVRSEQLQFSESISQMGCGSWPGADERAESPAQAAKLLPHQ